MKPDKSTWKYRPIPVILRYWFFQGMAYMNRIELIHRLILEILIFILVINIFYLNQAISLKFILAFFITHSLNLIINGHLIALCAHDLFWFSLYSDKTRFFLYMEEMRVRLARKNPTYLKGAFFWGSLTRCNFKSTSDLDVRFIPENGLWAGFRTANIVFVERWHAFWAGFPLDAYMFMSREETERKMDVKNEPAVSLWSKEAQHIFGGHEAESFASFSDRFISGL